MNIQKSLKAINARFEAIEAKKQEIKSLISVTKKLTENQLNKLANDIYFLSEEDFDVIEGAYYCYSAHAVASVFCDDGDGDEFEFRIAYPVSNHCFVDDDGEVSEEGELDEDMAISEAFERFCLDINDKNDIQLDYYY